MVDVKSMSLEELSILAEDISHELKKRKDMRFRELASDVLDAVKALKAEFPYVSYDVEFEDEDEVLSFEVSCNMLTDLIIR